MQAHSHIKNTLDNGLVLEVTLEELTFTAYVVISGPDINCVADFVPKEQFEGGGDLHVTAVETAQEAHSQIQDLAFNMNIGDAAAFLCGSEAALRETLEELGQKTYQDKDSCS